jgi:hypothetical protein
VTGIEVDPQDPKSITVGSTHWRLWQSSSQEYYATRGTITLAEFDAGHEATLVADTPEKLQELLLDQPNRLTSED